MRRSLERERRVIATIVFLVGAPGIVLTWLGIRLVRSEEKEVERRERAHYAAVAADADLAVSRALGFHAESVRDLAERLGPRVGSLDEAREVLAGSLEKEGVYERLHLVGPDGRLLEAHDAKTAAPAPPATVADESHPALASARRLEFVASDPAAARAEYERIVRSGPTDDGLACLARVGVARCFAKTGAREEALSALEQVVSRHPFATDTSGMAYSLGARLEMARIHADLGRDDSARWTLLDLAEFLLAHGDRLPADQVAYCWARCREALTRETSGPLAHGEPDAIAARWAEIETARRAPREGERERVEFEAAVGPWLREWLARDVPAPRLPIPVHFEDGWRPVIAARLRRDPEAPPLGAAVAVLDRERVLGDVVAPALAARSLEPDAVWIVTDMEGRPVVGELPEGSREPWIEVPLSALPYYRLSARAASGMGGNSSASTGPLLVWALVLSVGSIAAGLYVALRTVSREIASSRIQSDFVSSVTHELKTPLTAIQIFVETLREGRVEGPRETRECLDLLAAEAATLSRLIQRILDFSRMEEGTKAFRFQPVRLADVLARAIEPFRAPPGPSRSGLAGLAVSLDVPADLPPIVADPQALEEVLWNLLSNAKKYSPDGGEVEVSARAASGECRIAVRDRGIGIPARFREKIFEKFFRIEDDRTVAVEGTGLGLAIVRHIVRAHRGRVEVESVPGEGSTFTVVLPVGGKGGSAASGASTGTGTGTGTGTEKGKESWKPS